MAMRRKSLSLPKQFDDVAQILTTHIRCRDIDTLISDGSVHVLVWAMKPISYTRHRFPPGVIRHAVWLYLRFTLSYRDVEDLLAERGLTVSNESIRRCVLKFGPIIARKFTRE